MYSVVLMAALTAGTSTPSWGWGCHGGLGCFGGGHGCHGFFGRGGCYGGGGYGGGGYGCYGGYGSACYGGYGGCYGCYGGYGYASYGSGWYYGASCYGAGCYGGHGMPAYAPGQVSPPAGGPAPEQVPPPKKEEKTGAALDQARLIVELPADAMLYVDDRLTTTTSERRVFNSPRLEEGQTYYYILRAEVVRDGKTRSETKRVLVHAGGVSRASFLDMESLAAAPAEASAGRAEANARR